MTLLGVPRDRQLVSLTTLKAALLEAGVVSPDQDWDEVEWIEIGPRCVQVHCLRLDKEMERTVEPLRWSWSLGYAVEEPSGPDLKVIPGERQS